MKLSLTKAKQAASALLTTLVICSILSIFVMYYLSLIDQQSYLSSRSQVWNMAISLSEAGVEDGLQQLNNAFPDMNTDGWTYDGGYTFYKTNTIPGVGGYESYIFTSNSFFPNVMARAYLPPIPTYAMASPDTLFAAGGVNTTTPAPMNRAVLVTTKRNSPFQIAMVARNNIDLNGNGITTDSYNSLDPTESVNGQYVSTYYSGDRGDIATDLGVIDSIAGGNAKIYGHTHTGPGSPSTAVQIGPNGYIGPHSGFSAGVISSGWWMPDSNFTFPTTTYPNTSSYLTPTNGTLVTSSNALGLGSSTTYTYPSFPPAGGASTNFGSQVTSTTYPVPVPPTLTTNVFSNVSSFPLPVPVPLVTNTTYQSGQRSLPAVGTYVGNIDMTNWNNGKFGTYYSYWQITGYSYNTYTYYSSYTYTPYTTNLVYYTNYYDNVLWGTTTPSTTNYYVMSSSSVGNTIVVGENVVLALPNGLIMSGQDEITLTASGTVVGGSWPQASITVYSGGTSCTIGGNGIVNQPGYPIDFILYCAPTVTSLSFNGNGQFSGGIVAPSANVTMNGSGSGNDDFCGALIANSVTMNGHFGFHYDEAMSGANTKGRFLITSWNEVK